MTGETKWASTASMITAVGTLLAALVALAAFLVSQQFFAGAGNPDPDRPPPPTDAQGKRLDEVVLWSPRTMLLSSSMDFDQTAGPNREPGFGDNDMYLWWSEDTLSSPFGMVKWTGKERPGQNDCAALLSTHGTANHLSYDIGDRFCFKTSKARIAMIEVLRETDNGWEVQATAWKQRLSIE